MTVVVVILCVCVYNGNYHSYRKRKEEAFYEKYAPKNFEDCKKYAPEYYADSESEASEFDRIHR